jgi:hypothetical protein
MAGGKYQWGSNLLLGAWRFTLKEFFSIYNKIPEPGLLDLLDPNFQSRVANELTPLRLKILIESMREI